MKRIFSLSSLILCHTLAFATHIQPAIDRIINQVDPQINMGIKIVDLDTGEVLYQRHADQLFIPASNMKLYSDAAALLALGPDYRFHTTLSTNAPVIDGGVLQGSLYLNMPGDPSFKEAHLNQLITQLSTWGVHRISGNVVLASEHQVVNPYAVGVVAKDLTYSYGAPLAPVMLDENRLTVTVNPAWQPGLPAVVEFTPKNAQMHLDNQIKTAAQSKGCGISLKMEGENHLIARGCVGMNQSAIQQRLAIRNPFRYAQDMMIYQLKQQGITLDGQVVLGQAPASSFVIATHDSQPIRQLLADTLKPSDNLYADSLYLHAAAKIKGKPLNWSEAQPVIKQFLQQQTGISLKNSQLVDGSGLSRQDLLTAEQTVDLLRFLHDRFPLAYEYIAALPIAGQDGTLQRRLRKPNQQGFIRAKTGTMTGISSLSGYLYTANAHTLAFAIFINTRPGTKPNISGRYRSMVDYLCDYLLRQRPDTRHIVKSNNPHARVAFQQQPSQADRNRNLQYKWRHLEYVLKQNLQGQKVSVVFRDNQLELNDHGADMNKIWATLQGLSKKYAFSVALQSNRAPTGQKQSPLLVWVKNEDPNVRIWTVR